MSRRGKNMPFSYKQTVARLAGEAAFLNGKALNDNPYSMEKLRHAWHDAYVAARRSAEKGEDAEYSLEQSRSAELARRGAANW
jgi:hypothetical protein